MAKKSEIKNLKAFLDKLEKKMVINPKEHLKGLVARSTLIVEGHAKKSIASGSPSGRTYTRGAVSHTASSAGQPPATDTGFLVNNITSRVKTEGNEVIGQIIASAPYAKPLEFGTSSMSPRPFMQPALNKNRARIKRIFKEGGYVK